MSHGTAGASPDSIDALLRQALQLAAAQRPSDAITILHDALAREAAHVAARCLLAAMLHESGQSDAALAEIDAAPAVVGGHPALLETRATILLALARAPEAERAARAALVADPRNPRASIGLALALDAQRRDGEAVEAARKVLALQPEHALARRVLARCLVRLDRSDEAAAALAGAPATAPAAADAIVDELVASDANSALRLLAALCKRQPGSYHWAIRTARLLHQLARSSEALAASERARSLAPNEAEPIEMRAVALLDRGEVSDGLALYRGLLARGDASPETANRQLILLHYDPAQDNESLFREHVAWVRDHVTPFGPAYAPRNDFDPQRRLRVAWVSPRFEGGPVASFFTGLIEAFDRERFAHTLVALRQAGSAAASFRHSGDDWLALHDLADETLLRRLRAGAFDIAVDLAGHSFGNRLRVLAQRVAPIQLCWLDYFDTTAVPAIDGWISDAWLTPPDSSQRFTERIYRLPSGRFCYTPPAWIDCDRLAGDAPVFASFNRPAKFNDGVLDAWAEILRRVPAARLELGAALFGDTVACARTLERFAERGIAAERVRLHAQRSYRELLGAYREVDIALDPFPFSGCTTTCDALWMGVPVVARCGETFVSRQSASLLQRLGRDEWIASDGAGYVDRAAALAGDVAALRAGRTALRARTLEALCDAKAQARDFAELLRNLWRERCALVPHP